MKKRRRFVMPYNDGGREAPPSSDRERERERERERRTDGSGRGKVGLGWGGGERLLPRLGPFDFASLPLEMTGETSPEVTASDKIASGCCNRAINRFTKNANKSRRSRVTPETRKVAPLHTFITSPPPGTT
jgi:hypothetical protein